jgi:hypothetical protein
MRLAYTTAWALIFSEYFIGSILRSKADKNEKQEDNTLRDVIFFK